MQDWRRLESCDGDSDSLSLLWCSSSFYYYGPGRNRPITTGVDGGVTLILSGLGGGGEVVG